ncbi:hypothetical protein B0O99DRAFT_514639 [Bisporella sp. PMI_857]|nr:hypothetical protein B0O99DRAFT_514639 [Bisporella sp. PMI_857]
MPSAFHTFKLVPMAPTNINNRQPAPILPPSTPNNPNVRPPSIQTVNNQTPNTSNNTPTSETRMNPPALPRSMMTPAHDVREGSVASSAGGSQRKPRQNLEERDHLLMLKHCYEQRGNYKEGTKAQFWQGVNTAFQNDTGKILAQMSATVGRLVESRRRQIADWEAGRIASKPGGELNDRLDEWMEFLKTEDGDAEAERMRQVDARRKVEEARKEARRAAIAAEQQLATQQPAVQMIQGPPPGEMGHYQPHPGHEVDENGQMMQNGFRPNKRRRPNEPDMMQQRIEPERWPYMQASPPEPPRRVVIEGAMTKEDWREVMGNDARLRALEAKVDKIEVLVSQNNKLLLQLVSERSKERSEREEERVPVHLDAEFERDYL